MTIIENRKREEGQCLWHVIGTNEWACRECVCPEAIEKRFIRTFQEDDGHVAYTLCENPIYDDGCEWRK